MKLRVAVLVFLLVGAILAAAYGTAVIRRGFSAVDQPSALERIAARSIRDLGIPRSGRDAKNPWAGTPETLQEAREDFTNHCAGCHGKDGDGQSGIGRNLYPKAPDLRLPATQNLTDGEIHYIIKNGVRLTGMPALGTPHVGEDNNTAWKIVLFVRAISQLTPQQRVEQVATASTAHYVGSAACQKCHAQIYEHWKKTPMANVVRDPKEHPDSITPNLATNNVSQKFTKDQIAFVYGSVWKQRYFTKIGDDYFPEPAQWDVTNKVWRPYMVPTGPHWWTT